MKRILICFLFLIGCANNPDAIVPIKGDTGLPGARGPAGNDGVSCTVITLLPSHDNPTGGAQITCGSNSVIVINGASGTNGSASYVIVGSVDPCGPYGAFDEIFLRMASGQLVALYVQSSDALTARLSYIADGVNLHTTDTQTCYFNLTTDVSGVRTIQYTSAVVSGSPLSESWQVY